MGKELTQASDRLVHDSSGLRRSQWDTSASRLRTIRDELAEKTHKKRDQIASIIALRLLKQPLKTISKRWGNAQPVDIDEMFTVHVIHGCVRRSEDATRQMGEPLTLEDKMGYYEDLADRIGQQMLAHFDQILNGPKNDREEQIWNTSNIVSLVYPYRQDPIESGFFGCFSSCHSMISDVISNSIPPKIHLTFQAENIDCVTKSR